jgi:hypothetical protein
LAGAGNGNGSLRRRRNDVAFRVGAHEQVFLFEEN